MQDGATPHRANVTNTWLEHNNIDVMDLPAYSPDLNPIENIWGIMTQQIYQNSRQYQCIETLTQNVLKSWDEIDEVVIDNLVDSMTNRCELVIESRGKATKY